MSGVAAIERLEDAIELHPDDPDLRYTLARKLVGEGRAAEAARHMSRFMARWPDRRPNARVEVARSMIEVGDSEVALVLLDQELGSNPHSALARFYRGIALRFEGLIVESNHEFAFAARLAPSLHAESLLAQALGLFELGKEGEAVDLLRQILEIDPTSESAIRARLMLRQREIIDLQRAWRLDAYAGFEWDDNVLLESAANESVGTDQEDFRGIWGLGATLRALTTEKASLTLGYRFDQTMHDDLGRFDLLTNSGFTSGSLRLGRNVIFRLDALAWNTRRDDHGELTAGSIRPNLILSLGPNWGALRAFAQYEIFEYADDPVIEPFERDGFSFGGGVEHFLPFLQKGSFVSTSVSYQQNLTRADTSGGSDAFDGDYDYDSARLRVRVRLMLPAEIRAGLEASYANDQYHNINFLNTLGTLRLRKREDDIARARVQFSRKIALHAEFEVYWRGTWRMSNVPFFDYDQQVVGALIRVSTD
jgi:tetratricopeptide (TPR) repeat protein